MNVYLLRHGVAGDRDAKKFPNDDARTLTDEGVERMREAAAGIAVVVDRPDLILTSPLVRAIQTADIVAKELSCKDRVEVCNALRPGANICAVRGILAARAGEGVESVLLVGHEPDLGEIASELIGAKGSGIEFKKGSLCAIYLDTEHFDRAGVLLWHITPKQLRAIGQDDK